MSTQSTAKAIPNNIVSMKKQLKSTQIIASYTGSFFNGISKCDARHDKK
jgi:hypothetical protein